MADTAFDTACKALDNIDMQALRYEVETLRAVHEWALAQMGLDYQPGDRVVIVSEDPSDAKPYSGWYPYRRELAPGRTGIAGEIRFNAAHKIWQVDVAIDCDDGRPGHFFLNVHWVARAEEQPS